MAGPINYTVDPGGEAKRAILKAARLGLDLSFSMGEATRITKKDATKNFILKGSGKYPPLNPKYLKRKQILSPGAPILTGVNPGKVKNGKKKSGGGASGRLKRSIIEKTSDSIIRIGKVSAEVGTKATSSKGAPYPKFVQEGTKKMQARKFIFFSQRMVREIVNTINADIGNQL